MANIFSRPMFKLGGKPNSDGVGITSGLNRPGYANSNWTETIDWENLGGSKEIYEAMGKLVGPTMKGMQGAGKMDNYDLAMLISNVAGKGGSISDMVTEATTQITPYADRYKKTQAGMGPAAFQMLGTMGNLAAKSEAANKKTATEIRNTLAAKARAMAAAVGGKENLTGAELEEYNHLMKISLQGGFMTPTEALAEATTLAPILIGPGWEDMSPARKEIIINNLADALASSVGKIEGLLEEKAEGGRVGRAYGNPNPTMTETVAEDIQTPSMNEEMVATETMQAPQQPNPAQDPYIMLRARLPKEITDDVVRLIAYNQEAFKDFAAIETQQDVIDFNQTYGVELVVPALTV